MDEATGLLDFAVASGRLTREQLEEIRLVRALAPKSQPVDDILAGDGFLDAAALEALRRDYLREQEKHVPPDVREAMDDPARRLDHFVKVRGVGRGGLGEVWLGYDLRLSRRVAIKIPHSTRLKEILSEARVLARLEHPAIVPVHEVGPTYFVMAYVDGVTLDRAGLSPAQALDAIRQIAEALEFAHARGFVHADVKPGNIMVKREPDGSLKAVAVDFGIARAIGGDVEERCQGTPAFMAPEQLVEDAPRADAKSDVYGLGATLYTLLAGDAPFAGEDTMQVIRRVREATPPALPPRVPAAVAAVVLRAMSKRPADRPGAGELATELARVAARRTARPWVVITMLLATLVFAGVGGWALGSRGPGAQALEADLLEEGRGLRKGGNLGAAIERFAAAIAQHPERPDGWFERGMALTEAGKYEEAIEDLVTVGSLAPEFRSRVEPFLYYAASKMAEASR